MVVSTTSVWGEIADEVADGMVIEYEDATVYGDFEQEQILHQGAVRVLPTGRLLSPEAVHHIDP